MSTFILAGDGLGAVLMTCTLYALAKARLVREEDRVVTAPSNPVLNISLVVTLFYMTVFLAGALHG